MILAGTLMALVGASLAWNPFLTALAAVGAATSVWAAGSITRALSFLAAVVGLIAAALMVLALIAPALVPHTAGAWNVVFCLWFASTAGVLVLLRGTSPPPRAFTAGEIAGASLSAFGAIALLVKLDFRSNLLLYLLHSEDNAAWVKTTNQVFQSDWSAAALSGGLGPLIPTILGLLHSLQGADAPIANAAVEAYAVAILLTPLVCGCLVGSVSPRVEKVRWEPWAIAAGFTLITFIWAFLVPSQLATQFGHLSAACAFVAILLSAAFLASTELRTANLVVGLALMLVVAEIWFPVAPLAALAAIAILAALFSRLRPRGKVLAGLAGLAIGASVLLVLERSGISVVTNLGSVKNQVKTLYEASGGTASIEEIFLVLSLAGALALAACAGAAGNRARALSAASVIIIAYLGLLAAMAALLGISPDSYGLTKVTFVCGYAVAVIVIAAAPQVLRDRRALIAAAFSLFLAAFLFGGARNFLTRSWPGDGTKPAWITPLDASLNGMKGGAARPIACVSPTPLEAYLCTRWVGAVGPGGESTYQLYREELFNNAGVLPARYFRPLARNGTLDASDFLILGKPTSSMPWFKLVKRSGARLYGIDGKPYRR